MDQVTASALASAGGVLGAQLLVALIKEWYAVRVRSGERKKDLVLKLIATRWNIMSPQFLDSLNAVELAFNSDQEVKRAIVEFDAASNTQPLDSQRLDAALMALLSLLTTKIGSPMSIDDVRRAYSPRGPVEDKQREQLTQELLVKVLSGERMITVLSIPEPAAMANMISQLKAGAPNATPNS